MGVGSDATPPVGRTLVYAKRLRHVNSESDNLRDEQLVAALAGADVIAGRKAWGEFACGWERMHAAEQKAALEAALRSGSWWTASAARRFVSDQWDRLPEPMRAGAEHGIEACLRQPRAAPGTWPFLPGHWSRLPDRLKALIDQERISNALQNDRLAAEVWEFLTSHWEEIPASAKIAVTAERLSGALSHSRCRIALGAWEFVTEHWQLLPLPTRAAVDGERLAAAAASGRIAPTVEEFLAAHPEAAQVSQARASGVVRAAATSANELFTTGVEKMPRTILLIVLDCLRADHVCSYGYSRATTPNIDALAEQGCLWENAYSLSSWTKPSVASILTGLYPTQHGAFRGVKRSKAGQSARTDALRSPTPTLAESLSTAGWRCGAFINNAQLGEFTHLNRGFSSYAPAVGKADRLIGIFLEWLEAAADRKNFAYLHFLDTHAPYQPRRRHVAMFGGNRDSNLYRDFSARDYARLRRTISDGQRTLSDEELEQMMQMYDGAIRRLDGKLRIILAMLKELGLRDRTAIFITADHGEEFMEHGQIGHGQALYTELTHVPLIAQTPGGPSGVRRNTPVSQVDLSHTIQRLAQVEHPTPGCNLLDFDTTPRPVCSELLVGRRYTQTLRRAGFSMHRRYKFERSDVDSDAAATPREWVVSRSIKPKTELYDLRTDAGEHENLTKAAEQKVTRKKLSAAMDTWWSGLEMPDAGAASGNVEIDSQVVQRLRELGYMD